MLAHGSGRVPGAGLRLSLLLIVGGSLLLAGVPAAFAAAPGTITEFSAGLNSGAKPLNLVAGPDGNVWFTDRGTTPAIGRITPAGVITEFTTGLASTSKPYAIIAGPDGNMWFTDYGTGAIGRMTPPATGAWRRRGAGSAAPYNSPEHRLNGFEPCGRADSSSIGGVLSGP